MIFNDRFLITTPALIGADINSLTDVQLEALCPPLKEMVMMVKTYSVLVKNKTSKEIYFIITGQVDPRIALILAAARDNAGLRLFPDLIAVKQTMFGPSDPAASSFISPERNIFVDGIRRIAAALTASILIGQLAQITEQAAHSHILENQSLADLDRLLKVPDLTTAFTTQSPTNPDESKSFYFQPYEINLGSRILRADFYMPSGITTSWQVVNNYSGKFSTDQIVADIADAINSVTITQQTSNIISAPILGDDTGLYKIEFKPRLRDASISCEVITIRFRFTDDSTEPLPFTWGVSSSNLNNKNVNSVLLAVQQGKASVVGLTSTDRAKGEPTVIYFKRAPVNVSNQVLDYDGTVTTLSSWAVSSDLTFRVSPMMTENRTVQIPYISHQISDLGSPPSLIPDPVLQPKADANRPSQVAETLLNEMFSIKGDTLSLGALIRNDNPDTSNALVGLELIPFSVTNPEAWMILDILHIPSDVLMATGNLQTPLTPFSNKPRSIRIESKFYNTLGLSRRVVTKDATAAPRIVKSSISAGLQRVREDPSYRILHDFPIPPTIG